MKLSKQNEILENGKVIKGRWEITPNHEVQYRLEDKDEEIKFKGSLIAAEPDALVLSVTERQSDQEIVTSLVKLTGTWHANPKNQLVFEVEKETGKNDALTLRSGWKLGNNNQIVYGYTQTNLKTKKKTYQELSLEGYWDISEKNRLIYFLRGDTESAFRFRGAFQTRSILAKKGEIRYQIGVEVAGKHTFQTIALFGKWKVSRNLYLDFEIDYGNDKTRAISFGGEYALNNNTSIAVNLKNTQGDPLGVEVILTKDIFNRDGQAFIRLQKSLEESRVEAGMSFKW